jgi:exopolyphosphatase/guanosine-5'-triphosphate,3'-diphosphate pyrophosphatase
MIPSMARYAAIDCGTNSIRILIADVIDGRVVDVVREMRTVRLGEGVDANGEFSAAALQRTFAACEEYAQLLLEHPVEAVRFIATSASRDVRNRAEFIEGVRERLGVTVEVVAGTEEAELSFLGAVRGLEPALITDPVLVADIGGGSTEYVLGSALTGEIFAASSVNIGCVRMTERHLQADPPELDEVAAAVADIDAHLAKVQQVIPAGSCATFIGLAGSVTTVAAMAMDLPRYDAEVIHGSVVTRAQVKSVTTRLLDMPRAERAAFGFMHPGRVDVIAGGSLVLCRTMQAYELDQVVVSEADLLDGIVYKLSLRG